MGVATTGSLVRGMNNGMEGRYNELASIGVVNVYQYPNNILTNNLASGIAYDVITGSLYLSVTQNGSTWTYLGSIA